MRRAPKRLQQGRKGSGGAVFLAALAAFAVICGVVILIVGSGPSRQASAAGGSDVDLAKMKRQVHKALGSMQAAEGALTTANYGSIRGHLQRARESLAVVNYQIKEAKKVGDAKRGATSKK